MPTLASNGDLEGAAGVQVAVGSPTMAGRVPGKVYAKVYSLYMHTYTAAVCVFLAGQYVLRLTRTQFSRPTSIVRFVLCCLHIFNVQKTVVTRLPLLLEWLHTSAVSFSCTTFRFALSAVAVAITPTQRLTAPAAALPEALAAIAQTLADPLTRAPGAVSDAIEAAAATAIADAIKEA